MNASMREVNQQTAHIFDVVAQGESVTVSKNGKPIAVIRPYDSGDTPVYPFRTDPVGEELEDMPVFDGPADLSTNPACMEGFEE
jgi:prevent-host-death family protein